MSFCWENGYHGIMADDAEYAVVNPPRYFSAKSLKMTFQFEISTVEYVLDEVAKSLDLNPNRFCLLGALLGNHILPAKDLREFHYKLAPELKASKYKLDFDRVIRAVVKYIRALPKIDDYDQLGTDVFGDPKDQRVRKLRASVQYYASCSQEGHLSSKAKNTKKKKKTPAAIKLPCELEDGGRRDKEKKAEKKGKTDAEEGERTSGRDDHADLVERIALDLDNLELSEAISAAAKAIGDKKKQPPPAAVGPGGDCQTSSQDEERSGEADESPGERPGEDGEAASMSVLQALASGVEVEAAEEGKVDLLTYIEQYTIF